MSYINNSVDDTSKYKKLLELIPEGLDNAIPLEHLSLCLHLSGREIKQMITSARIDGLIIGSNSNGYYIPENETELIAFYNRFLHGLITRSRSMTAIRKRLNQTNIELSELFAYRELPNKEHQEQKGSAENGK